jgi:hypothetical protein
VAAIAAPVARRVAASAVPDSLPAPPDVDLNLRVASLPVLAAPRWNADNKPLLMPPAAEAKQLTQQFPSLEDRWPYPSALLRQLEVLLQDAACAAWAQSVHDGLRALVYVSESSGTAWDQQFAALESLAEQALPLAQTEGAAAYRTRLLRARFALLRRLVVWKQVHRITEEGVDTYTVSIADTNEVARRLDAAEQQLGSSDLAHAWRQYLCLDELRLAASAGDASHQRRFARSTLARMNSLQLNAAQAEFLKRPDFDNLAVSLRAWAGEPLDCLQVLESLELYEETQATSSANELANYYQVARWSTTDNVRQLAEVVNTYYRNANLRVALNADMLNRLLPSPVVTEEPVRDTLLGAQVRGTSQTSATLNVVLIPDPHRWNVGVKVDGEVDSRTSAIRGPARFYSDGFSRYAASKPLTVDRQGVHMGSARTRANLRTHLRGVETSFDSIPVLGWLARAVAWGQHDRSSQEANWVASAKLRRMASNRVDEEVERQIADVEEKFQKQWLQPLRRLNLQPVALDMQTTTDELLVRYRLASDAQLGAHTPRPEAPRNSLLSVQVHESALNNTLEQMKLEGQRFEVRELYSKLADDFQRSDAQVPDDIPDGMYVRFADRNAIRVRCDDSRLTVTIRIAELKNGRRKTWRNFAVRAYYVPDTTQLDASLVRDGGIELAGERDIALLGIFAKVLSKSRPFKLVNEDLAQNPKLQDVKITQFTIDDGWVGVALGADERAAEASAMPVPAPRESAPSIARAEVCGTDR